MPTIAFHTLGCKVNQYDSQAMLERFLESGYTEVPFDGEADVYVVNTCTVNNPRVPTKEDIMNIYKKLWSF